MPAKFGINVTVSSNAARPVSVESTTPVAIVGDTGLVSGGLECYTSVSAALDTHKSHSVYTALKAIEAQGVETPVIISSFVASDDTNENISAAVSAVEALKNAKSKFGYTPNIIIAPGYSHIDAVSTALVAMSERLKATAYIDIDASSSIEAITKADGYGTKRAILCYPKVAVWDTSTNNYTYEFASGYVAGLRLKTDGESETGYADSASNRTINGIVGLSDDIDFELGETCTADELRASGICTIIHEQGWRLWGEETTDVDTIWQSLTRVRIFDRISRACQDGVLFAVDRKASELYHARRTVEECLRGLVGAKVLLGYNVNWSEKNTDATVTAGKFYLDVAMQDNPTVKLLTLDYAYTDSYAGDLMSQI